MDIQLTDEQKRYCRSILLLGEIKDKEINQLREALEGLVEEYIVAVKEIWGVQGVDFEENRHELKELTIATEALNNNNKPKIQIMANLTGELLLGIPQIALQLSWDEPGATTLHKQIVGGALTEIPVTGTSYRDEDINTSTNYEYWLSPIESNVLLAYLKPTVVTKGKGKKP